MRKSIFELVQETKNPFQELLKINDLFASELFQIRTDYNYESWVNIETTFDEFHFAKWKARGTCVNVQEFRLRAKIDYFIAESNSNTNAMLTCLEYYLNLIYLVNTKGPYLDESNHKDFYILKGNCEILLSELNHVFKFFPDKEIGLVLEDNPSATSVAEIVADDLAFEVIRYNHHLLKGDIAEKKSILRKFDTILEPRRAELKAINKKLEDNLFFGLNNIHILHNNIDPNGNKNYKQYVADMNEEGLEMWYDEVYQLILLAILLLENTERGKKFDELKEKLNGC